MLVDGFKISPESPVYLIAEMSANHNGNIETAINTIESAKLSGANAIKLQTYTPDSLTIKSDRPEFYLTGGLWGGRNLYDLYKDAHTPYDWHETLFRHAKECGITIFSTPFDDTAVELLEGLNTPAYKIASFEIIDIPLIKRVASTKKPLFMSTGAASINEITEAVQTARKNGAEEILLFHCISSYPAPAAEAQLKNIKFLRDKYGVLVGLSDHTIGSDAGFLSVAMGATAIEKHFIMDKSIGGADADFSATPRELKELRAKLDLAKQMLGVDSFLRSDSESQSSSIRRSIYSVSNKKKGNVIMQDDIKIIRPGLGLHPRYFDCLVGATLRKDLSYGEPLDASYFDDIGFLTTGKSVDFNLEKVAPTSDQEMTLYKLLAERKFNISHNKMPSIDEHKEFVRSHPYRAWWLIHDSINSSNVLGSVYVSFDNSLGLNIDLDKISFTASFFTQKIKKLISPVNPKPSKIYSDFYYNVSPNNQDLINWLVEAGYYKSQISFSSD
jgi:N-acetylneuraminate synthase